MGRLLDEDDVIKAIEKAMCVDGFRSETGLIHKTTVYEALKTVPSAQPEYRLDEWCTDCKEYDAEKHRCPRFNQVIRTTLDEMESERKRGKWLRAGTHHGVQMYQCSECGEEEAVPEATNFQTGETSPVWEYCPYCGSYMRGEQNEGG